MPMYENISMHFFCSYDTLRFEKQAYFGEWGGSDLKHLDIQIFLTKRKNENFH